MDKLTRQQSNLCIIAIVGMGGIGKTTLPRNAYAKPLIMHQFDSRARVTVSQNYNVQEILLEILFCISKDESLESLSMRSEDPWTDSGSPPAMGWIYVAAFGVAEMPETTRALKLTMDLAFRVSPGVRAGVDAGETRPHILMEESIFFDLMMRRPISSPME
ncbi:PREDICTED: uncharacterized protein LOC105973299 [Erythranthe guttata]|uniref:uncharacterized protein LOC105973299 n=1 Tax=Erythranthe guttata TaxID=4155 RepID=UPI00064DBBEF|nr:PREDICTED: uncharacterized protein LOC105973299 [Erythranthe guttata]|eukprot:XP_012853775.1 PREDICTED: uncharacterized protein LOC105973299 [Erythranthe guttata]